LEQVKKEGWTMFGMHFPTAEGVKVEWLYLNDMIMGGARDYILFFYLRLFSFRGILKTNVIWVS
jgi:hypothetical protein